MPDTVSWAACPQTDVPFVVLCPSGKMMTRVSEGGSTVVLMVALDGSVSSTPLGSVEVSMLTW